MVPTLRWGLLRVKNSLAMAASTREGSPPGLSPPADRQRTGSRWGGTDSWDGHKRQVARSRETARPTKRDGPRLGLDTNPPRHSLLHQRMEGLERQGVVSIDIV